ERRHAAEVAGQDAPLLHVPAGGDGERPRRQPRGRHLPLHDRRARGDVAANPRYSITVPTPTITDAPPTCTFVMSLPDPPIFTCSRLGRPASTPCRNTMDPRRSAGTKPYFAR